MTLPSRRKHRTIAPTILLRAIPTRRSKGLLGILPASKLWQRLLACGLAALYLPEAAAQQPAWQPTRISPQSTAQPISRAKPQPTAFPSPSAAQPATVRQASATESLGSGVVLRWKSNTATNTRRTARNVSGISTYNAFSPAVAESHSANSGNPLRTTPAVRQANYQQQPGDPFTNPFGDDQPPQSTPQNPPPPLPDLTAPNNAMPSLGDPQNSLEAAPPPSSILEPPNPFPNGDAAPQDPSPFDRGDAPGQGLSPDDPAMGQEDLRLPPRREASVLSCNELRDRIRSNPLTAVDLDVSPSFGRGMRSVKKDNEQQRLDFAASSPVRDWMNTRGQVVASGRMIDLRDDRVVIDVDGKERAIPIYDLSDVDWTYIGQSWDIPVKCGTGYEPVVGREFIASAVQWKASGLCHKPLYFEDVQLERYGHEAGPVLQPLISTVHFFGNIAVLPYKMGIHPPQECQYALGYYRPGNCAPYMVQPIPWSLRGAAAQAGFVSGAAALIP